MRTTMLFLAASAAALGACKWTEFDDLENETWVTATDKPNVRSADYGVSILNGQADVMENTVVGTATSLGISFASVGGPVTGVAFGNTISKAGGGGIAVGELNGSGTA